MRVIAGSARRLVLKTPEGKDTRPTLDRIKETLFNIIQDDIYGCNFLDLFAGSGGIGIEALSRGAAKAVFVDSSEAARECIRYNLNHTRLADKATLLSTDALAAVPAITREGVFDIVYMDPPYGHQLERRMLEALKDSGAVKAETLYILETELREDIGWLADAGFEAERIKEYKTNRHIFVRAAYQGG